MSDTTTTIEAGDIVRYGDILCRVYEITNGIGSFYKVTNRGWRDRRWKGWSGPIIGYELVRKCEFPTITQCQKCGKESPVFIGGRCPGCNPLRACPRPGCVGDLQSRSLPHWMNRFVCDTCGYDVSR